MAPFSSRHLSRNAARHRYQSLPYRPAVETLEDRNLLSTSIPLDPVNWTALGPEPILNGQTAGRQPVSGRISAIAADPNDANVIYLAAAGGGVWKTTDAGAAWTPLTDDQPTLFMGALALAPSDPNVIYAGTGEATNSALSFYGRGVLKSTDAGATWTLLGSDVFDRRTISQIVVSPVDPDTVFAAVADGGVNGVNSNQGVWKSTDGGLSWTDTTTAISRSVAFSDLTMDPTDPQTLYAAAGAFRGSAVNGLYKTTDGGATWTPAGNFHMGVTDGRISVAVAASDTQTLFALVSGSGQGGTTLGRVSALKSTDGGATWTALNIPSLGNGWYGLPVAVDPADANHVWISSGGATVLQSVDGGSVWFDSAGGTDGNGPHSDHHAFAWDANGNLLDGNDGGIWRVEGPTPQTQLWIDLNTNLQLTQYIGIALDPTNADIAYGGSQDNGTSKFNDSLGWQLLQLGDGGFVRVDPSNPNTVYHEFNDLNFERSDDGGRTWRGIGGSIDQRDPHDTYVPFVLDSANPSRLLLGTNRVYETFDRGVTWRPISAPGSNGWTGTGHVDSLATTAADPNTIYASAGGHIFVTFDDGASWQQRDVPGVADHIQDLQVDPNDPLTAYAVRDRFGGGHVFLTIDGGLDWNDLSAGLPNLPAYTLALDSTTGNLYIGMDDGVYLSTDQGNTWSPFGAGLPHAQVRQLEFNADLQILAAGTHGRGLWEILVPPPDGSPGRARHLTNHAAEVFRLLSEISTAAPERGTTSTLFDPHGPPFAATSDRLAVPSWPSAQQEASATNGAAVSRRADADQTVVRTADRGILDTLFSTEFRTTDPGPLSQEV
jgi:photosystem II stability/assembly factor-like uncharacterized protein